jgi:hypothetical protein
MLAKDLAFDLWLLKVMRAKCIVNIRDFFPFHYEYLHAFVLCQEMVYLDWLHSADAVDINHELGSFPKFALYRYWTTHLLNDIFANRKTQSSASRVSFRVLFQFTEVYEQMLKAFLWNSTSCVDDANLQFEKLFIFSDHWSKRTNRIAIFVLNQLITFWL